MLYDLLWLSTSWIQHPSRLCVQETAGREEQHQHSADETNQQAEMPGSPDWISTEVIAFQEGKQLSDGVIP